MSTKALFAHYIKEKKANDHAKLSASGSERWLGCPGSVRLSEGIPSVDSPAGIRGTNTHTLLQFILENPMRWAGFLHKTPEGKKFKLHIEYDSAMLNNALFAREYVYSQMVKMETRYGAHPQKFTESRLELSGVGFGTADIILYHPYGLLHVMDYKNGTKGVNPEGNTQGLYYAVAAADKFGWEFSEVAITIIQPNCPHKDGHIRTWKVSEQELSRAGNMLRKGALATKKKNAPLVKNHEWCFFCPAQRKCPEHKDARNDKARRLFGLET